MNSRPYKLKNIKSLVREIDDISFKHSNDLMTNKEFYKRMDIHRDNVYNYLKKCFGVVSIPLDKDEYKRNNYLCYILNKRTDKVMKIKYTDWRETSKISSIDVLHALITDISCYLDCCVAEDLEDEKERKRIEKIVRREYNKFIDISDMPITEDYIHYIYRVLTTYM